MQLLSLHGFSLPTAVHAHEQFVVTANRLVVYDKCAFAETLCRAALFLAEHTSGFLNALLEQSRWIGDRCAQC